MAQSTHNLLKELLEAGIIDQEISEKIIHYLRQKEEREPNRQLIVFSILGAVLVGLGIILIVAHNWDNFGRTTKAAFAFLPLVLGQGACFYTLLRKNDSISFKEGSSVFLFFAAGASIALVSQVYNIEGSMAGFLLTWMLMVLPLVYLFSSSATAILYLIGITTYAVVESYFNYSSGIPWFYWLMLLAVTPHYFIRVKRVPQSNFTLFLHWFYPASVAICLGTFSVSGNGELMVIAYICFFNLLYLIGIPGKVDMRHFFANSYRLIGAGGLLGILMVYSFLEPWSEISGESSILYISPEFWLTVVLAAGSAVFLVSSKLQGRLQFHDPLMVSFIVFILAFLLNYLSPYYSLVLINFFLLAAGILIVIKGSKEASLGILNYGLLIIAVLTICRFLDAQLSFVIRGMLFLIVGIAFFLLNYKTIQKKKLT